MMKPKFMHAGNEITAGQALDVWLGYSTRDSMASNTHLFADAMVGFKAPVEIMATAGIEIRFGDSQA